MASSGSFSNTIYTGNQAMYANDPKYKAGSGNSNNVSGSSSLQSYIDARNAIRINNNDNVNAKPINQSNIAQQAIKQQEAQSKIALMKEQEVMAQANANRESLSPEEIQKRAGTLAFRQQEAQTASEQAAKKAAEQARIDALAAKQKANNPLTGNYSNTGKAAGMTLAEVQAKENAVRAQTGNHNLSESEIQAKAGTTGFRQEHAAEQARIDALAAKQKANNPLTGNYSNTGKAAGMTLAEAQAKENAVRAQTGNHNLSESEIQAKAGTTQFRQEQARINEEAAKQKANNTLTGDYNAKAQADQIKQNEKRDNDFLMQDDIKKARVEYAAAKDEKDAINRNYAGQDNNDVSDIYSTGSGSGHDEKVDNTIIRNAAVQSQGNPAVMQDVQRKIDSANQKMDVQRDIIGNEYARQNPGTAYYDSNTNTMYTNDSLMPLRYSINVASGGNQTGSNTSYGSGLNAFAANQKSKMGGGSSTYNGGSTGYNVQTEEIDL